MGPNVAYWAPGVTDLGWTIAIAGNRVVVNKHLGEDYKRLVFESLKDRVGRFATVVMGDIEEVLDGQYQCRDN
jgi:hypothetical protein